MSGLAIGVCIAASFFLFLAIFPVAGTNEVEKPYYKPGDKSGRVYINANQYFDRVPQEAWEFYIGGYQPAQKWLKDRKGCQLLTFVLNLTQLL